MPLDSRGEGAAEDFVRTPIAGSELEEPGLSARITPDRGSLPVESGQRGTGWSHRLFSFSDPPGKRGLPFISRKRASIAAAFPLLSCGAAAWSPSCDGSVGHGPQPERLEVGVEAVSARTGRETSYWCHGASANLAPSGGRTVTFELAEEGCLSSFLIVMPLFHGAFGNSVLHGGGAVASPLSGGSSTSRCT